VIKSLSTRPPCAIAGPVVPPAAHRCTRQHPARRATWHPPRCVQLAIERAPHHRPRLPEDQRPVRPARIGRTCAPPAQLCIDLTTQLLKAHNTDGYETVWFYQRLSAACANTQGHEESSRNSGGNWY